jgi:hypothetical protein
LKYILKEEVRSKGLTNQKIKAMGGAKSFAPGQRKTFAPFKKEGVKGGNFA